VDTPPEGWGELVREDPAAGPWHRPELWAAIAASVPDMRAAFLAVERDGALAGGAPVVIERRGPLHRLHALPWGLPGAALARPGAHAEVDAAVGKGLAHLQRASGAAGGGWVNYRPGGPPVSIEAVETPPGETRMLEASVIDLEPEGIEAAARRMHRKTRQDLHHARAAGLRFAEEPDALEEAYALHLAQARTWPRHRPLPLELARRLLGARSPSVPGPAARLFTLRDRRGVEAALLALDHPRETLPWWSGVHPEGRHRHASGLLLWSVVEWAAAAGRSRVNLGSSAGIDPLRAFKASLGARAVRYPVRWLAPASAPLALRLAAAMLRRLRPHAPPGEAA
jgi:hypothetical protein